MTDTAPVPAVDPAVDEAALRQLEVVVRRAFAIEGGYRELNGILLDATGDNLFDLLGLETAPMKTVVETLRVRLVATGQGERVLVRLFERLAGNVELREWVARYCPRLLDRVPPDRFETERTGYEKDRMDRRVKVIEVQLRAIGTTVRLRGEHRALARLVIEKLDELTDYKAIHDALHGLQMEVLGELGRVAKPDILPADRIDSVALQVERLQSAIEKIDGRFCEAEESAVSVGLRRKVVAALRQIVQLLTADPAVPPEVAEAGAGLLRAALRQQMSLFDSKLVEASDAIPFQRFADVIRALPQPAPSDVPTGATEQGDPILASNVGDGFADIEARLVRRRTVHGLWQQVESTLLNIEELLRGTGRAIELYAHWQNLEGLVAEIAGFSAEHGLLHLPAPQPAGSEGRGADAASLAEAVRSPAYLSRFGSFAGQARVRFQRADTALINDCERLKRLQQPLQAMLGD